jgi:2-polyprenyl-6-methoxyphenol hydroxylase-like FAD-dependent oxidoreductase
MTAIQRVQCCIVGGGPAGMVLAYLMGRAHVKTLLLEKHADFLRDFRGDTVHPSTLRILLELGLLDAFLRLPHSKIHSLSLQIEDRTLRLADFSRLPAPCNFAVLMPQWDFLNFLAEKAQRFPVLQVERSVEMTGLLAQADTGRITGVTARTSAGEISIEADLVVACDGRHSTCRRAAGLKVQELGAPIDVLWFRLPRYPSDPTDVLGHLQRGRMLVSIDRGRYWQCAYVIRKGGIDDVRAAGIPAFRQHIAQCAHFLADRVGELKDFDEVKLLSVAVDRLQSWSRPGLLCIGDAAHAMSPVGGVGINLAIQDAVAAANLLAAKLRAGKLGAHDLELIMRRRLMPVKLIQALQLAVHAQILQPVLNASPRPLTVPPPLRLLDSFAWLRRWPAQLLGVGIRAERVR